MNNFQTQTMANFKKFQLNGQHYCTTKTIKLINLINYFNYDTSLLVLEYNNTICNKNDWKNILVNNKDKIEIVTIVGGG